MIVQALMLLLVIAGLGLACVKTVEYIIGLYADKTEWQFYRADVIFFTILYSGLGIACLALVIVAVRRLYYLV